MISYNRNLTAFNVAAGTATPSAYSVNNNGVTPHEGAHIVIDITVNAGAAANLTVNIEGFDDASGKWYPILASASLTAVATTVLRVMAAGINTANLTASDMLPAVWRVRPVHGNVSPITYTIGVNLLNSAAF